MTAGAWWKLAVLLVGPGGLRLGFVFLVGDSAWPSDGVLFDGFDPVALGFVIDFELSFLARFLAKERLTKRREITEDLIVGIAVPSAKDDEGLRLVCVEVRHADLVADGDLVVVASEKSVPRARVKSTSNSPLRDISSFCISLAALNSWFSRKSP